MDRWMQSGRCMVRGQQGQDGDLTMHQGPASKMWKTARGRPIVSGADSHGFKLSFSQAMGGRAIGAGGGGQHMAANGRG